MTEITELPALPGSAARPGNTMTPRYITIHNTANTNKGAGALGHARYLRGAGAGKQVSYHYAVDDGCIARILPDTENAWHAGDGGQGTGNRQSLAIEICENPESSLAAATDNAAELTAHLMRDWNIPLENVVQHNRWSGKNCPRRLRAGEPYDWTTFLLKVSGFYAGLQPQKPGESSAPAGSLYAVQTGAFRSRGSADAYAASLRAKGVDAFVTQKQG